MSSRASIRRFSADSERGSSSSPLLTVRLLLALARLVESHAWAAFAAVSLACGWGHVQTLVSRNLDYDELFTFYIAQAPTLGRLFEFARTIDFHPPLSYLLVRASFAIFGANTWACRVPFLLTFFVASALLFWLVRRLLSALYGLIAVLTMWSIPFTYLSVEARPYALLLCFTMLMLVGWYAATDGNKSSDRRWALAALATGGAGLLFSHVLGVLCYGTFFAAEIVSFWIRRKADWRLWAALAVPLPATLIDLPLIRNHTAMQFAQAFRITPLRMFGFYFESMRYIVTPLVLVALLSLLWPLFSKKRPTAARPNLPSVGVPFGFLLVSFSLIPLAIGIFFARTGAYFFDRYGIVWLIPLTLVPVLVLGYRTDRNELAGCAVALLLWITLFFNTGGKAWLLEQIANLAPPNLASKLLYVVALPPIHPPLNYPPVPSYISAEIGKAPTVTRFDTFEPSLPLVAHTALTFLELDRREPSQVQRRLYLLSDEQAAATIAHDTVFAHFERATEVFPIHGKVEPYCSFVAAHSRFLVVGAYNHPIGWLLRKLDQDGAELRVVGVCSANTEDCQIYEVNVRNAQCQASAPNMANPAAE